MRVIFVTESGWQVCGLRYHLLSVLTSSSYIFGWVGVYGSFCHFLSVAKPVHMSHFVNFHYRSSRYIVALRFLFVTESEWQVCGLSYYLLLVLNFLTYIWLSRCIWVTSRVFAGGVAGAYESLRENVVVDALLSYLLS